MQSTASEYQQQDSSEWHLPPSTYLKNKHESQSSSEDRPVFRGWLVRELIAVVALVPVNNP